MTALIRRLLESRAVRLDADRSRRQSERSDKDGSRQQSARLDDDGSRQQSARLDDDGSRQQCARLDRNGSRQQSARFYNDESRNRHALFGVFHNPTQIAITSSVICCTSNLWIPLSASAQERVDDSQIVTPADGKAAVPKLVTPYDSTPTVITAPPPAVHVPKTRPKIGLALGGGGTRGAAHIGALRVLEKENIPIDMVVGTSMGAVVGGLYCAGLSPDEMQSCFKKGLMKSFMSPSIPVRVAIIPILAIPRLFGYAPYDGFYKGSNFKRFLQKSLPEGKQQIEKLNKPFGAVALNLLNGQAYCITKGDVGEALQGSAALPILRRPVKIDKGLFVDGGVVANLPCTETRALGAKFVIAVDVDERFEPMPDKSFRKIGSVAHRVLTLHLAKVDENQRKDADIVIHPNVNGISLISTKKKNIDEAIAAGEEAARLALPEIREKLGLEAKSPTVENINH